MGNKLKALFNSLIIIASILSFFLGVFIVNFIVAVIEVNSSNIVMFYVLLFINIIAIIIIVIACKRVYDLLNESKGSNK
ncbi:biotin transporter BioY [Breznakia pachnodae]|uniref:Biotin transporter BioY n=1 Tax=Breznakia pachnodae TaxID=265178 RepID=A0ABU0DZY3_9FIRM|nr:biotin transporter BioY [Breznakia pachnodae]